MTAVDPRSHDLPQILADMSRKMKDLESQIATLRSQTTLDHGSLKNVSDLSAHDQYDFGHFQPYMPLWSCDTTAPSLGNGVLTGRYCRLGEIVLVYLWFQGGSSTTFGSGNFNFSMPSPFRNNGFGQHVTAYGGKLFVQDYSGYGLADKNDGLYTPQSVQVELVSSATGPVRISATSPFTWGNGDFLELQGWYEAAP